MEDREQKLSGEALRALQSQSELGEVVNDLEYEEDSSNEESDRRDTIR